MGLGDRIRGVVAPPMPSGIDGEAEVVPIRRAQAAAYAADRPLVAAAERIDLGGKKRDSGSTPLANRPWGAWQRDAWEHYDAIAEIKYAYALLAAVMSRLRLYPAINVDPDAAPASTTIMKRRRAGQNENEKVADRSEELALPDGVTDEVMAYMEQMVKNLGSGPGGIPGLLRSYSLNMSVPGECYLCEIDKRWSFRSTEEITIRETDNLAVLRTVRSGTRGVNGTNDRVLSKGTYVGRIWKQHPRFSGEPDSAMLSLAETCEELLTIQRMIRMIARSKMNAGVMFIPDGIESATPTETVEEAEQEVDPLIQELIQSIIAPIGDEASVSSVAPFFLRGSREDGEAIRYITMDRASDQKLVDRADRALERILQGIDVPKDIVTGLANVKYSNAVQIDESLYKSHVEPLALALVDALTQIYLKPGLEAKFGRSLPPESLDKCLIWYDPTEVVTKPDPASAAGRLYDNYELSGDALRRANGFSDTDAPSEDELARRVAVKQVPPPDIVAALVKHALPHVFQAAQQAAAEGNVPESAQRMLYPDEGRRLETSTAAERETPQYSPGPDPVNPTDALASRDV